MTTLRAKTPATLLAAIALAAMAITLCITLFTGTAQAQEATRPTVERITVEEVVGIPDGGWKINQPIVIWVKFDQPVHVEGSPSIGFYIGDKWRGARFDDPPRGNWNNPFVKFVYLVKPGDFDDDGIRVHPGYVDSNGRTHGIGIGPGNDIIGQHGRLSVNPVYDGKDFPAHTVDGVSEIPRFTSVKIHSKPESGDTYRYGEHIELEARFNKAVTVQEGGTFLTIHVGDDPASRWRGAHYNRGSGTDTLIFRYTVKPLDRDTSGISALWGNENYGLGGSGKITARINGTDVEVDRTYDGFSHQGDHKVNGSPLVTDVSVSSTPESGNTYGAGETIQAKVELDQEVEVTGDLKLYLALLDPYEEAIAENFRPMPYTSGAGTNSLYFEYTVVAGDSATSEYGIAVVYPRYAEYDFGEMSGRLVPVGTDGEFELSFNEHVWTDPVQNVETSEDETEVGGL